MSDSSLEAETEGQEGSQGPGRTSASTAASVVSSIHAVTLPPQPLLLLLFCCRRSLCPGVPALFSLCLFRRRSRGAGTQEKKYIKTGIILTVGRWTRVRAGDRERVPRLDRRMEGRSSSGSSSRVATAASSVSQSVSLSTKGRTEETRGKTAAAVTTGYFSSDCSSSMISRSCFFFP